MKDLAVLILAGGSGSRFWPFYTDKLLFPFFGRPLIEHTVMNSLPAQAKKVIVVTNNNNHAFFERLSYPVTHELIKQPTSLGMANAIVHAANSIKGYSLLILIADDIINTSFPTRVIQSGIDSNAFGVISGFKPQVYFPGGYLVLENNRVVSIIEKPGEGNEPSPFVTCSGHYIADADELLHAIQLVKSESDDVYEKALAELMKKHEFIFCEHDGNVSSLKYPWHVLSVMDELLPKLTYHEGTGLDIKPNVVIEGPVYFGNNVKVMEFTKIVGPAYIGDNTIIGNNNVIRFSMIGNNCVTGFSTDITRSYIGDNCWFHTNYIGDSVLESNISMGSGSVLANLKLNEGLIYSAIKQQKVSTQRNKLGAMIGSNVRIGVNTSIMPGMKIGSGSFISAGITISQDIPEQSFVRSQTSVTIQPNEKQIEGNREQFKQKI